MCPFLNRIARRRDGQLRALGHTRMIYPLVGIVSCRVHYYGPQFLETFGPLCHQRQPCAGVCVPRWVDALILADAPSRILPLPSLPLFLFLTASPALPACLLAGPVLPFSHLRLSVFVVSSIFLSFFDENLSVTVSTSESFTEACSAHTQFGSPATKIFLDAPATHINKSVQDASGHLRQAAQADGSPHPL